MGRRGRVHGRARSVACIDAVDSDNSRGCDTVRAVNAFSRCAHDAATEHQPDVHAHDGNPCAVA
jgi:hypothetical protein